MANSAFAVATVAGSRAKPRAARRSLSRANKQFWQPITSAARYVAWSVALESPARRLVPGSKKALHRPPLAQTLAPVTPDEPEVLELDELWSFVRHKKNKRWIWLAVCRRTRQVVAYAIGDRSEATCRRLWSRVPPAYRHGLLYSDFWQSYQAVLPDDQHQPVDKSTGETNHVERWNLTLRQRLGRFVRKTLSFSKCEVMHEQCLRLFFHEYNLLCLTT